MRNDITVYNDDASRYFSIYKELKYGNKDIYILRGASGSTMSDEYYIGFFDERYSMYTFMKIFTTHLKKIFDNGFKEEDIREEISCVEHTRVYFTAFSELERKRAKL